MSRDKVESAESERVNNLMMGEKKRKGNKKQTDLRKEKKASVDSILRKNRKNSRQDNNHISDDKISEIHQSQPNSAIGN